MATKKRKVEDLDTGQIETLRVADIHIGKIQVGVIGTTPLLLHRLTLKTKKQLIKPPGRKTAGEKKTTEKHEVWEEFRDSPEKFSDPDAPTLLGIQSVAFKKAMIGVATDVEVNISKAELGRLTFVESHLSPIFGIPQVSMMTVRQSGPSRTPDVRTRAIVERWGAILDISFVRPNVTEGAILKLLSHAGVIRGVGDYRAEKGSGNYGSFRVVEPDDPDLQAIVQEGSRAAQVDAMESPVCYDTDTMELLAYWSENRDKSGRRIA